MNTNDKQTLTDLYRWLVRAQYATGHDERQAALFGHKLRDIIDDEDKNSDVVDHCRDALMDARVFVVEKRPSLLFSRESTIGKYFKLLAKIDLALKKIS